MSNFTYNLSELLKQPVGKSIDLELNQKIENFDPSLKLTGPIQGLLNFTRIDDGVIAQLTANIKAELVCARCNENFQVDLPLNFMQEYWEHDKILDDRETPRISPTGEIDLLERIQQEILIQIPIKPLCSKLCKGICPKCGQNLNIKQCSCPKNKQSFQSPFAKLKDKKIIRSNKF